MSELQRACEWDEYAGNNREYRELEDSLVQLYLSLITEEFKELQEGVYKEDRIEVLDALGDLLKVVQGTIHVMGYDPDELLRVINDSNFSKYCLTKEDAEMSVDAYQHKLRYEDVYYEQVGEFYIVRGYERGGDKSGKGKVLKGYLFEEPKIAEYHNSKYGEIKRLEKIEPDELTQELQQIQEQEKEAILRKLLGL